MSGFDFSNNHTYFKNSLILFQKRIQIQCINLKFNLYLFNLVFFSLTKSRLFGQRVQTEGIFRITSVIRVRPLATNCLENYFMEFYEICYVDASE